MTTRRAKVVAIAAFVGMLGGAIVVPGAVAQTAPPTVPDTPNVADPAKDANYANDQGLEFIVGEHRDNVGPANVSDVADILAAWFTHDADAVSAHMQVAALPPSTRDAYLFRVHAGPDGCLFFQGWVPASTAGGAFQSAAYADLRDTCDGGDRYTDGELTIAAAPDGTGIVTIRIPRSASGYLEDGSTLTQPYGSVRHIAGVKGLSPTAPQVDSTKVGLDYLITPPPSDADDPPGEGKKKGCSKGKGKKKGACPGRKDEARDSEQLLALGAGSFRL